VNILSSKIGSLAQYPSMNRDLEIALVSGALAIFWGYALQLRLREGFVQPIWKPITRQNNPCAFWTVMLFGALGEVVFVGLAVTHFLTWL
jgi:hypothetical protein